MNINFEDITGDESSGTGWGGAAASGAKYYKIYASFFTYIFFIIFFK